jgi:hypothetical protein
MALPRLNDVPMYTMVVPSTGKQVKYRPFLVKEQKVLMIASESQDKKQMMSAMLDTIEACIQDDIKVKRLPTFDVDYMFLQIRGKSVGENSHLNIPCSKCEEVIGLDVDISKIKPPEVKLNSSVIKLTNEISVKLNYPSYINMIQNDNIINQDNVNSEFVLHYLVSCIESVQTAEENILMKDEPDEDKIGFIESLTTEQFDKLSNFVQNTPKIEHNIKVKCEKCGEETNANLEGIQDFF